MSAIETFLGARVRESWCPGAAWWVERSGVPCDHGAVGAAETTPHPRPLSEDTPFDLASLTKPLATAFLLVLLAEEAKLGLGDPAERWAPELDGSIAGRAALEALARHESGLPAWRPLYLEARGVEEVLRAIGRLAAAVEPGTTLYSDPGYIVLGAVLERAAGRPLTKLFHERLAVPLGLPGARFATTRVEGAAATEEGNAYERSMAGERGAGYAWRTGPIVGQVHDENAHALGGASGHAGLFATAREVARIAREILAPRVVSLAPSSREAMLRAPGRRRTVGFDIARNSRAARGIFPDAAPGHTGFTGTSIWIEPDTGAIHVLLTNRVHPRVGPHDLGWLRRGFHRLARQAVDRMVR